MLPGTCNLERVDPDVELDILADARPMAVEAAVTNSFGFGGMNAVLVLAREDAAG
jgi:3-oxoacyl-[acyl-carrier-protein] synthase II